MTKLSDAAIHAVKTKALSSKDDIFIKLATSSEIGAIITIVALLDSISVNIAVHRYNVIKTVNGCHSGEKYPIPMPPTIEAIIDDAPVCCIVIPSASMPYIKINIFHSIDSYASLVLIHPESNKIDTPAIAETDIGKIPRVAKLTTPTKTDNTIGAFFKLKSKKGFQIGYGYEFLTGNDRYQISNSTHELMLRLELKKKVQENNN